MSKPRPALYVRCLLCRGTGRYKNRKCKRCNGTGEPPLVELKTRKEVEDYAELLLGAR